MIGFMLLNNIYTSSDGEGKDGGGGLVHSLFSNVSDVY